MIRALFELLGIDYGQWRVLTRIMLKIDLRSAGPMQQHRSSERSAQLQGLLVMGFFYALMGLFLVAVALVPDVFAAGAILITVVMFMIGSMVLIEYQSVVISPDDHAILAFQPITSRTYFAVKLTNVAVYVGVLATLMGGPSILTHAIVGGPWRGFAAAAAVYAATAFVTLAILVAYAAVLRFVHPQRLRRVLSYLQLFLSVVMYGGYAIFPQLIDAEALASLQVEKTVWLLLYPPTWFASLLELGAGRWGPMELAPAGVGLVSIGVLFGYGARRLSLSYAARLADLASASESPAPGTQGAEDARPRRAWSLALMGRNEHRAVGMLVRAQFRFDLRFRMGVLAMLPLTGLYVFMALREGPLPDPFVATDFGDLSQLGLIHMAMIFMPILLMESMATSDSFRAAWVFFTTPADRARLVMGTRNVVLVYFVVPYLAFVGAIFAWFFATPVHALVHVVVFGLIALLTLDALMLVRPQLPFSRPARKGQRSGMVFVVVGGSVGFVTGILPLLLRFAYARTERTAVTIAVLVLAGALLRHAVARRAGRVTSGLEFAG